MLAKADPTSVADEVQNLIAQSDVPPEILYNALCACSMAVEAARENPSMSADARDVVVEANWQVAAQLLDDHRLQAYLAKPETREHAQKDVDLKALRAEPSLVERLIVGSDVAQ